MAPYDPPPGKPNINEEVDESLWYLDYYRAPTHLRAPPWMLRLPNELLAAIASFVRNRELCQLSLVNRRLRDVAQSSLMKPVRMPRHGIRKFVEMIVDRPDLVQQIIEVDLGDFGCKEHGVVLGIPSNETIKRCKGLAAQPASPGQWRLLESVIEDAVGDHLGRDSGIYLSIRYEFLVTHARTPPRVGPFQRTLLTILQ